MPGALPDMSLDKSFAKQRDEADAQRRASWSSPTPSFLVAMHEVDARQSAEMSGWRDVALNGAAAHDMAARFYAGLSFFVATLPTVAVTAVVSIMVLSTHGACDYVAVAALSAASGVLTTIAAFANWQGEAEKQRAAGKEYSILMERIDHWMTQRDQYPEILQHRAEIFLAAQSELQGKSCAVKRQAPPVPAWISSRARKQVSMKKGAAGRPQSVGSTGGPAATLPASELERGSPRFKPEGTRLEPKSPGKMEAALEESFASAPEPKSPSKLTRRNNCPRTKVNAALEEGPASDLEPKSPSKMRAPLEGVMAAGLQPKPAIKAVAAQESRGAAPGNPQAAEARQAAADLRMVGTWVCGLKKQEYSITVTPSAALRYVGQHPVAGAVSGILESRDSWMQTELVSAAGLKIGSIRVRFRQEDSAMVSNFRGLSTDAWGKDNVAHAAKQARAAPNEQPARLPQFGAGSADQQSAGKSAGRTGLRLPPPREAAPPAPGGGAGVCAFGLEADPEVGCV